MTPIPLPDSTISLPLSLARCSQGTAIPSAPEIEIVSLFDELRNPLLRYLLSFGLSAAGLGAESEQTSAWPAPKSTIPLRLSLLDNRSLHFQLRRNTTPWSRTKKVQISSALSGVT